MCGLQSVHHPMHAAVCVPVGVLLQLWWHCLCCRLEESTELTTISLVYLFPSAISCHYNLLHCIESDVSHLAKAS
jgi:hypothetical protein